MRHVSCVAFCVVRHVRSACESRVGESQTLDSYTQTLDSRPSTLDPRPQALHSRSYILNPRS
eukprot:2220959-Rhodomonas_salina.1